MLLSNLRAAAFACHQLYEQQVLPSHAGSLTQWRSVGQARRAGSFPARTGWGKATLATMWVREAVRRPFTYQA